MLNIQADELAEKDDEVENTSSYYEQSANYIMEAYRTCTSDVRADPSAMKKIAILNMTNQLFRIYFKVVEAVKEGNLANLDQALESNEHFFIQCGIFLVLEKLRAITFRTLFKRISSVIGGHQIPLKAFFTIIQYLGVNDVDEDKLECIVANLIAEKTIKGSISHQHQKSMVSCLEVLYIVLDADEKLWKVSERAKITHVKESGLGQLAFSIVPCAAGSLPYRTVSVYSCNALSPRVGESWTEGLDILPGSLLPSFHRTEGKQIRVLASTKTEPEPVEAKKGLKHKLGKLFD
ncbi:hypothetical protein Q1695_010899 [Nippostrongylus brasiliensis]|nr:hypothetical protein Q1695_010899 [Nippostrongylus brasiliensis]